MMRLPPTLLRDDLSSRTSVFNLARLTHLRYVLYTLIAFGIFQGVYVGLSLFGAKFIGAENGPVELAQPVLALWAGLAFLYTAKFSANGKAGLTICAAMLLYAAAREQDTSFESLFFDDAYKWLVGMPLLMFVIITLRRNRLRLISELTWLSQQTCVIVFVIAGIYLTCVCQLFDRPDFWSEITSFDEAIAVKALIEETSELFAYLLLAFSGLEALLVVYRPQESTENEGEASVPAPQVSDGDLAAVA